MKAHSPLSRTFQTELSLDQDGNAVRLSIRLSWEELEELLLVAAPYIDPKKRAREADSAARAETRARVAATVKERLERGAAIRADVQKLRDTGLPAVLAWSRTAKAHGLSERDARALASLSRNAETRENERRIKELAGSGLSIRAIADRVGLPKSTVAAVLKLQDRQKPDALSMLPQERLRKPERA